MITERRHEREHIGAFGNKTLLPAQRYTLPVRIDATRLDARVPRGLEKFSSAAAKVENFAHGPLEPRNVAPLAFAYAILRSTKRLGESHPIDIGYRSLTVAALNERFGAARASNTLTQDPKLLIDQPVALLAQQLGSPVEL